MVYLWWAVDAEGEVFDVLVQSKRNKHAALKLMRKLLKKYAFVTERLVTDDLRSYSAAVRDLGIERRHVRDASLADLRGKHWAKPVPPEPDGRVADVDPTLGQEIFDVSKRQWDLTYIITTRRMTSGELLK